MQQSRQTKGSRTKTVTYLPITNCFLFCPQSIVTRRATEDLQRVNSRCHTYLHTHTPPYYILTRHHTPPSGASPAHHSPSSTSAQRLPSRATCQPHVLTATRDNHGRTCFSTRLDSTGGGRAAAGERRRVDDRRRAEASGGQRRAEVVRVVRAHARRYAAAEVVVDNERAGGARVR